MLCNVNRFQGLVSVQRQKITANHLLSRMTDTMQFVLCQCFRWWWWWWRRWLNDVIIILTLMFCFDVSVVISLFELFINRITPCLFLKSFIVFCFCIYRATSTGVLFRSKCIWVQRSVCTRLYVSEWFNSIYLLCFGLCCSLLFLFFGLFS